MFSSIRTKLTLWYVGFLTLVVVMFGAAAYQITVRELDRDLNRRLEEISQVFIAGTKAETDDEQETGHDRVAETGINEFQFRDYHFVVRGQSSAFTATTKEIEGKNITLTGKRFSDIRVGDKSFRVFETGFSLGTDQYKLLVLHSLDEEIELKNRLLTLFLLAGVLGVALAGIGGYFLVRQSIAPVIEMSREAGEISAENLGQRLSVRGRRDEVGQLGQVINDLLARLDHSFEQQRRFMADASHELRTPLAIVRGEAEVALSKDDRSPAEYRESLSILHDESKRLTKIVEDLFTLARVDAGQVAVNFAPVYLDEIVSDAIRSMRVLADQRQVAITIDGGAEMPFDGDESLLRRMILNLLDNAVKYSHRGGKVVVNLLSTGDKYQISVSDNGIGIPDEDQPKIFDRFYRVDRARSRSDETATSGAGLGLSITRWIAEMHGGKIVLVSSTADGSTFSVIFPR